MNSWENHQAKTFESDSTESIMTDPFEISRVNFILAAVQSGKRVADLGSNHGHMADAIRLKGNLVTAVDLPEVVDVGRVKFPELEWKAANLEEPFADAVGRSVFDVVVASEIIEHLVNIDGFMRECVALLKQGGLLAITTPNAARPLNTAQMLKGYHVRGFFDDLKNPMHIRFYTLWTLKELLAKHGFYNLIFDAAYTGNDWYDESQFSVDENFLLQKVLMNRPYPRITNGSILCAVGTRGEDDKLPKMQ